MDKSVGVLGAWGRLELDLWVFYVSGQKECFGGVNRDLFRGYKGVGFGGVNS